MRTLRAAGVRKSLQGIAPIEDVLGATMADEIIEPPPKDAAKDVKSNGVSGNGSDVVRKSKSEEVPVVELGAGVSET